MASVAHKVHIHRISKDVLRKNQRIRGCSLTTVVDDANIRVQRINRSANASEQPVQKAVTRKEKVVTSDGWNKTKHPGIRVNRISPSISVRATAQYIDEKEEEEERKQNRRRRVGAFAITRCCCCCLIASVVGIILLATLAAVIALLATQTTSIVITSTSCTTRTTTTVTTSTSTSSSTSSSSTSSATSTTSITTSTSTTSSTSSSSTSSSSSSTSTSSSTSSTSSTSTSSSTSSTSTSSSTSTTSSSSSSSTTSSTSTSSSTSTTSSSSTSSTTTSSTTSSTSSTSTTSTSTTSTTTTSTTSETTTSSTSTTATTSTTSVTTTITTVYNSCTFLRWNQTGIVVAGTGTAGSGSNQFQDPSCVEIDANDTMYVCDHHNYRVQMYTKGAVAGVTVLTTSAATDHPEALDFDSNGYMYIDGHSYNRVVRYSPDFNTSITAAGVPGCSSTALNCLNEPYGMDFDSSLNLYIAERKNKRVVKWAPNATNGTIVVGTSYNFYGILLSLYSTNQAYISSEEQSAVFLWTFGASTPSVTLTQVNGSSSSLSTPRGIQYDTYGNLYVCDRDKSRVIMYCVNSTVGRVVVADNAATDLKEPYDVAFDSSLNMFVVDKANNRVIRYARI